MKEFNYNLRTNEEDKETMKQAAENLSILTDEKPSISKAIRAGVKILAETDPNQPILFYVNRQALQDIQKNLEYGKAHLQAIHNEYLRALGHSPTMTEIESWFGVNRSNYLVTNRELLRESILIKLYMVQRAKYPDLQFTTDNVILPDLDPLIEACGQLIFIPEINRMELMLWMCFEIKDNEVCIIPEAVETFKNGYRVYAVTPEEKARLAAIKRLTAVMDAFKLSNPEQMNIPGVVSWDAEAGIYTAAEHYVKGFMK
jgi:hypothetical protein